MIRVVLPAHLRTLARVDGEVKLAVQGPATQRAVLDALEVAYPMLRGTIRDHVTHQRRAFVRFFACEQDLSHESPDAPLPDAVAVGAEPLLVVGAMAGGDDSALDLCLTPLAAAGLVIIMIGATGLGLMTGSVVMVLSPLVVGLLAAFIAYGRWRLAPHKER